MHTVLGNLTLDTVHFARQVCTCTYIDSPHVRFYSSLHGTLPLTPLRYPEITYQHELFFLIVLHVYDVRLKRCTLRQTFVHSKCRNVNFTLKFVTLRIGHTSLEMNVGLGKAPAKA